MRTLVLILTIVLLPLSVYSASHDTHRSKYAGEENREIKSLSADDIDELRNGGGWGLAKAAELNGVPGPAHLLEMKKEIDIVCR